MLVGAPVDDVEDPVGAEVIVPLVLVLVLTTLLVVLVLSVTLLLLEFPLVVPLLVVQAPDGQYP